MKIGFIGSGKVGFSLGKYFAESGQAVTGYCSKTLQSAKQAAEFTGTSYYDTLSAIVNASDTIFITTPDGIIKSVWQELKKLPIENKLICHCSGSLSSTVFSQIDTHGAFGYSVHPLQAISSREHSYKTLAQCLFTIEGNPKNISVITELFRKLGNEVQIISAENKTRYHAAAVTVSNHMLALFQCGIDLLISCGFDEKRAASALLPLMEGNLDNLKAQGVTGALTGPVERCDAETLGEHLAALTGDEGQLYKLLCARLIPIAKAKNPKRDYAELEQIIYGGTKL